MTQEKSLHVNLEKNRLDALKARSTHEWPFESRTTLPTFHDQDRLRHPRTFLVPHAILTARNVDSLAMDIVWYYAIDKVTILCQVSRTSRLVRVPDHPGGR